MTCFDYPQARHRCNVTLAPHLIILTTVRGKNHLQMDVAHWCYKWVGGWNGIGHWMVSGQGEVEHLMVLKIKAQSLFLFSFCLKEKTLDVFCLSSSHVGIDSVVLSSLS